jgi:hypothetical protein
MASFEEVVLSQATVGTMTTWRDIIILLAVLLFIIFVAYQAEKMNVRKLLQESSKHAGLMRK